MNRTILNQVQISSNDIPGGLLCVYCKRLLLNPLQSKCGHRFCEDCQGHDMQISGAVCPRCNCEIDELQYDYAVNREIFEMIIKCPMDDCALKNGIGKFSNHLSHCTLLQNHSQYSNTSDDTIENGELEIISSLDESIDQEMLILQKSVEVLTTKTDEIENLTKRYETLKSVVNVTTKSTEKNMKDFIQSVQENYRKLDMLINKSKHCKKSPEIEKNDIDIYNELSYLKQKYTAIEGNITSQNEFNKNIEQTLAQLNIKIKAIEDEKKLNFNQFYEEVEYLANEFSVIKTSNEKKVIQFYNKIDRHSDKLANVATKLPELFKIINILNKKVSKIKKHREKYNDDNVNDIGKEISNVEKEVGLMKETIFYLIDHYPSSVFVTIFFQEGIGMNMSLREMEIFIEQFKSTFETMRKDLSSGTESNRSSLMRSNIMLQRKPAFNMSDRKKSLSQRYKNK